jgi:peptide/nickel transport system permease protein
VTTVAETTTETRARGRWTSVLGRMLCYRSAQLGLAVFVLLLVMAFVGPYAAPHSTTAIQGVPYATPSGKHPLGLDYLGRDALSRFLSGGRSVIVLSFAATLLGFVAGIVIGATAGYFRNWLDELLMRASDIVMAFPAIILILVLVAGLGSSLWLLVVAVAVTHAPRIARVVRGATLEVAVREYVEAAEARGETLPTILRREILPNIWTPILVDFGIRLTASIILIASLSFLGFGLQPPAADWGLMINENRPALTIQPWVIVAPVVAIALLTISVNLIGDGLARALGRSLDRKALLT